MILIRYGKKEDSVELYALIGKEWECCFILLLERYFGVRAIVEKKSNEKKWTAENRYWNNRFEKSTEKGLK